MKKFKKFLIAVCLMLPCAFSLTACKKPSDETPACGGGTGGICKNNSCEYTDYFNYDEFLTDSFYTVTNGLGITTMGNYNYNVWAEMMFGHVKNPTTYYANGEDIVYQAKHAVLCKKCGNVKLEKHTFEHQSTSDGFTHNVKCTACDYTH